MFSRVAVLSIAVILSVVATHTGCTSAESSQGQKRRVIVLGIDGMDPKFVEAHWSALPNLSRLRQSGDFKRLATTIPPQSPVAWSTFITGMNPGGHGIYDFIHRNPDTMAPFSSMSETSAPGRTLSIGPWVLPLAAGQVKSLRTGKAFWQLLSEHGVHVNVVRMPTNFPPLDCEGESLSGMGTPDIRGTFGTFTFFTDEPGTQTHSVPGGQIVSVRLNDGEARLRIEGPPNTLRKDHVKAFTEMIVNVDPTNSVARFRTEKDEWILHEHEWSRWMKADFPLIPALKSASGMFRVYVKSFHPYFRVYVSPVNIDPETPELPLSDPPSYSRELAKSIGPFYTQGMAEDTAAFRQGIFDREEYLAQSRLVAQEHLRLLRYAVDHFRDGLLFYHFFGIDQNSHMLWGKFDEDLLATYRMVDDAIGWVVERAENAQVIVMSDHGFSTFDRTVHLNSWLRKEGFLALEEGSEPSNDELFAHVDWSKTRAYSVGLNAIYVNVAGRERDGIVNEIDKDAVVRNIADRLLQFRDPATGARVADAVYRPDKSFSGAKLNRAPDLIVGYMPGYRSSWQTALGAVPGSMVEDNKDAWIGDHCIAPHHVPGVLFSNRPIRIGDPALQDITVTVLNQFGVSPAPGMSGRPIY